jgi:hydroxymethylpyrimidine/phosphomethylpyrimidine kinase
MGRVAKMPTEEPASRKWNVLVVWAGAVSVEEAVEMIRRYRRVCAHTAPDVLVLVAKAQSALVSEATIDTFESDLIQSWTVIQPVGR